MRNSIFTFLLLFTFTIFSQAQEDTVTLSGISFTPQNLTITAGETVLWDNTSGFHNVNGSLTDYPNNPEGFFSGQPASAPWSFSHTFTIPGTYDYQCDVHVSSGMTGTITVLPASAEGVVISEIMYNNPGADDYEFIELYNNGSSAVDLNGWSFTKGVSFTFPAHNLAPGDFVLVAIDSAAFETAFGATAYEWSGGLNNGGETIELVDDTGTFVDSVAYDDANGWPTDPDGHGPSLVLCDYGSDNNDPANWEAAITPTGFVVSGTEILANPGDDSACPGGPIVGFLSNEFSVAEDAGNVLAFITLANGNANATEVTVVVNAASTATAGADYSSAAPMTLTFPVGAITDTISFSTAIIDDADIEPVETIVFELTNPSNGAIVAPGNDLFTINIVDNDTPTSGALVITGVFDTQVESGGTWAKGIEMQAIEDIPDLSIFGVGSANNGTGTPGVETALPAISVTAGDCIYVANDSMYFFGFAPTATGDAANINGDDAIELYENNIVIDVFGEINVDGTGEPWEYTDGWAYRKSGTGPDGNIFVLGNWFFSGVNAFDNVPNNSSAPVPFPVCSYSVVPPVQAIANNDNVNTEANAPVTVNILANDELPNPLTSLTVTTQPSNGTATANGLDDITYTPDPDYCGTDIFIYEICDSVGCDEATVTVTVACPTNYPAYDIATVTTVDADGLPDSLGVTCQLQGIVHGIDFQGNTNIQFYFIDQTGGISLFSSDDFGYTVTEGDEVVVQGAISHFNCLTQINPDTLWLVSQGNPLVEPLLTTFLDESTESELIRINNLTLVDPGQWTGSGSGFNVDVTNG
ncbi:MAG: lamin tail domain-containing protein, partial [Saprospiraceae bacterium]